MGAEPQAIAPPSGRIRGLDGLRAISIIIVTLGHIDHASGTPLPESARVFADWAATGVNVFFVISGYLITNLLLQEHDRRGGISLSRFYWRRSLRILPAFLFWLGVLVVLGAIGWINFDLKALPYCLTYTANLFPHAPMASIGQVWSLCVEEHFYLIWPLGLVLLGKRRAPGLLLLIVLAAPLLRMVIWRFYRHQIDIDYFTPTRLDTIAVGCALAFFMRSEYSARVRAFLQARADLYIALATAFVLVSVAVLSRSGKYGLLLAPGLNAAAIAVIIGATVSAPRSVAARLLETRPLVGIGVLSYSLYLGQTFSSPTGQWPLSWWWNVPVIFGYALISYFLIERPFLKLKDRWHGFKYTRAAA